MNAKTVIVKYAFFGDIEDEPKVDENVFVNFYATDTTNVEHSDNKK